MPIIKWSTVGVTLLMGLANAGQVGQEVDVAWKVLGVVLGLAALGAIFGVLARASWGATALVAVAAVNVLGAVIGAVAGQEGWPIGLVLSVLGVVLGGVYVSTARVAVAA